MSEANIVSVRALTPGFKLPDIPVEFLEQFRQQLFPGMHDANTIYDPTSQQYIPANNKKLQQAITAADTEKDTFVKALLRWDSENANDQGSVPRDRSSRGHRDLVGKVRANISQQHTWDEVLEIIRSAQNEYTRKRGVGQIRRFFRRVADNKAAIEPWIAFIPDGDYTSIACGGIKFLLGACVAAKEGQDKVFDLIDELPRKLTLLEDYSELYREDQHLQIATHELYASLLFAIERIILQLTGNSYFNFFRTVFLQKAANAPLDSQIDNVRRASDQVESAIQLGLHKRMQKVSGGVDNIQKDMAHMANAFLQLLYGQQRESTWIYEMLAMMKDQQEKQLPSKSVEFISRRDLLDMLQISERPYKVAKYTPGLPSQQEDTEKVLRLGYSMSGEQQVSAEWLMANQTMRKWLRSPRSVAVMINGNGAVERVTSLSFFCAMLVRGFSILEPVVVLTHFCGLHASESAQPPDYTSVGANLMLRSLTYQLLSKWKYGPLVCLDELFVQKLEREARSFSLDSLWDLFQTLVEALPPQTPLLVVIDNISYYEMDGLERETKRVVKALAHLAGAETNCMVKFLVTAASRAMEVGKYFDEEEKIWIPESPQVSGLGFSQDLVLQALPPTS